jgi:hypothetical protein
MFKTQQVNHVDVNEWVDKLLAAQDAMRAVEKIRSRLDDACRKYITEKRDALATRTGMYDFYYEPDLYLSDLEKWLMDVIDYRMPDDLVKWWSEVCTEYYEIKTEEGKGA